MKTTVKMKRSGLFLYQKANEWSEFHDAIIIGLMYFIVFFPLLVNTGVFWDGWTILFDTKESYKANLRDIGMSYAIPLWAPVFTVIRDTSNIYVFRFVTYLSFLGSTLIFNKIIRERINIDAFSRWTLVLLFTFYPVNLARVSSIVALYSVCNFSFFLATYLLSSSLTKEKWYRDVGILLLYFISFIMNSNLIFFYIPVFYFFFHSNLRDLRIFSGKFARIVIYFLFPLVVFVFFKFAFSVNDLSQNYNAIGLSNVLEIPLKLIKSIYYATYKTIKEVVFITHNALVLVALLLITTGLYSRLDYHKVPYRKCIKMIVLSMFLLVFASISYIVVGKPPIHIGWETRHQILMPVGIAFLFYYSTQLLLSVFQVGPKIGGIVFILIVSVLLSSLFVQYSDSLSAMIKQDAVMEFLVKNKFELRSPATLLYDDQTAYAKKMVLQRGGNYRFYELSGYVRKAIGTQAVLIIDLNDYQSQALELREYSVFTNHERFNIAEWKYTEPKQSIIIRDGKLALSVLNRIRLAVMKIFSSEQYFKAIKGYFIVYMEELY